MELSQERRPASASRNPLDAATWPVVPQHSPEKSPLHADITLPDLKTVLSHEFEQRSSSRDSVHALGSPASVRSLPRIDPGHAPTTNGQRRSNDMIMTSPRGNGSAMGAEDRAARSTSVVSMEDPDVRMAAEALSGLGNPAFARSSQGQNMHISAHASPGMAGSAAHDPEPLLELIAQAHPWVGGTIKGSISAYSTTKHYSPRFVQYGYNLVERNITTPVVSAVSSVGGITGMDNGVRRYLEARRPTDLEHGAKDYNAMEIEHYSDGITRQGRDIITEQLPAYGASRPPSYREEASPASADRAMNRTSRNRSWSSQVFVTTSGLSVALSTTSRHSLRFCLNMLSHAFANVEHLTRALSIALNQYEGNRQHHVDGAALEKGPRPATPDQNENARQLANDIRHCCDQIMQTLKYVVDHVNNYAGGALPANAREFVRAQLMSLPQRWRLVSDGPQSSESDTSRHAQRMIAFATEGLDMITQVSGVLKATLESAERWLERVGRRDQQDTDQTMHDEKV
ncbi:unnamed protein product [Zymoseptoria tritici ST99CH_3D1]|nr:unnamed protein product [Zymoseptoria tritici ST99CH_3D1]